VKAETVAAIAVAAAAVATRLRRYC
jgi:hypothetical protein